MPKPPMIRLQHHQQEHSASCLAACVVMALAYWQVELSEAEVRRIIRTKPYSGTHPVNLIHLSRSGFRCLALRRHRVRATAANSTRRAGDRILMDRSPSALGGPGRGRLSAHGDHRRLGR